MIKLKGTKAITLVGVHTGSASGYLAYKKIRKENIKTHELYICYEYS